MKKFPNAAIAFQWVMEHPEMLYKKYIKPWVYLY